MNYGKGLRSYDPHHNQDTEHFQPWKLFKQAGYMIFVSILKILLKLEEWS